MKAKNKEVNIFNMSLLDILCGAPLQAAVKGARHASFGKHSKCV